MGRFLVQRPRESREAAEVLPRPGPGPADRTRPPGPGVPARTRMGLAPEPGHRATGADRPAGRAREYPACRGCQARDGRPASGGWGRLQALDPARPDQSLDDLWADRDRGLP